MDFRPLDDDVANLVLIDLGQQLRERDVLRGRTLARVLEERKQCQQQQNNNNPEGEIAQIGVHRSSFVVARIAALCPWVVSSSSVRESLGPLHYNLGVTPVDAKGTRQDYLTHVSRIPAQIMAVKPVFSEVVKTQSVLYDREHVFDPDVIPPGGGAAAPVRRESGRRSG
jgi:hypothetical protein